MGVYEDLGVRRIVNAWGPMTRVGGSVMRPEVRAAIAEAGEWFVDLDDLQRRVGRRIAELIGVDGCYVCGGAAAGLAISTAAILAGSDPERIRRLPDTTGMKSEVVVHAAHRNGYDHAIRQTGVRLVEVGDADGTTAAQLEVAIGPATAAVAHVYARWTFDKPLSLAETVRIAHAKGVPVIVDAAAEVPPLRNLRALRETGADVVIFSGGKGLMGPQNTGLILAAPALVAACAANGSPNHSLGRSMKVGKEELVGIAKAVELSLTQDETATRRRWDAQLDSIERALRDITGLRFGRHGAPYTEGIPVLRVSIDAAATGRSAAEVAAALAAGDPDIRVWLAEGFRTGPARERKPGLEGDDWIAINPHFLEPGEEEIVARRLRELVGARAAAAAG